jgi:hypothetical protein
MGTGSRSRRFPLRPSRAASRALPPSGDTRKLRQDDIGRRENYAVAANVALAAGGVFSAIAIVAFVWH